VREIKVCEDLSRDFGLHLFNMAKPDHNYPLANLIFRSQKTKNMIQFST
jgi:hypothetical protein